MAKEDSESNQEVLGESNALKALGTAFVEAARKRPPLTTKHIGSKMGMKKGKNNKDNIVRYMSYPKDYQLFVKDTEMIVFTNHIYLTDDPEQKKFLDTHSGINKDFWKDKFPENVVRKFEEDKKYLTRQKDMYTPAEA